MSEQREAAWEWVDSNYADFSNAGQWVELPDEAFKQHPRWRQLREIKGGWKYVLKEALRSGRVQSIRTASYSYWSSAEHNLYNSADYDKAVEVKFGDA